MASAHESVWVPVAHTHGSNAHVYIHMWIGRDGAPSARSPGPLLGHPSRFFPTA